MSDAYAIADVIRRCPGFVVELRELCVFMDRNGIFKVTCNLPEHILDESYGSAHQASYRFLEKRKELGFGFDIASEVHIG